MGLPVLPPRLAAACVALGFLGCAAGPRTDLVLITLDTTRPDHLGAYGFDQPTSPNLDRLAAESIRFDHAYAHVPLTLPSHTSMMTGTTTLYHGARDNGRFVVREDLTTLAELVRDAGYRTAAFVSAFVLDSRFGLDQGFELYDDDYSADWSEEDVREAQFYNTMVTDRRADQTTDRALAWLDALEPDERFFLWVHYYDPHQRYRPPPPYDTMFPASPYDGEIAFMDSQVGRLLDRLRESGRWDETLIVATSDHGESLGAHGEPTHGVLTYDATMHVALTIKPPAAARIAPAADERTVSHRDVLPTLMRLLGWEAPAQVQGRALLPAEPAEAAREHPIYFECQLPLFSNGWDPLFGVRTSDWKYIHAPQRELYHISEDPEERFNLAEREPAKRSQYEDLLFRLIRDETAPVGAESRVALDGEARAKLAALGYVSGGSIDTSDLTPRQPTGRRNPVQAVALLQDYFGAATLAARGQLDEAAAVYESVLLPLDPRNPSYLTGLGDLRRRLGDLEGALDMFRRAQAVSPEDPAILVELARLELDRGRPEAAEELVAAARQLAPEELAAAYTHARVAAARGEHELAVERYRQTLALDASHRDARLHLAIELGRLGRLDEARSELVTMIERWPFSAQLHYNLGIVDLRAGEARAAVAAFEQALRYRAAYLEARYALGAAKAEAGDPAGARAAFEQVVIADPDGELAAKARQSIAELGRDG